MSASRSDTSPIWSPDGRRIGFHSCSLDLQRCDLALMRPDGQARRALVRHIDGLPSDPVWSPDGRQLAYTVMFGPVRQTGPRSQGRTVGVYVVRADGSGLRRVAQTRPVGIDVVITSRQPGRRTAAASPTPTSAASWRSSSQAASDARLTWNGADFAIGAFAWSPGPRVVFGHSGWIYTASEGERPTPVATYSGQVH